MPSSVAPPEPALQGRDASAVAPGASVDRHGVEIPTAAATRVRLVGSSFLRARPMVVAPAALAQLALLATAGPEAPGGMLGLFAAGAEAPLGQRIALLCALGPTLAFFVVEAVIVRRRLVTERWLFTSLALTAAALLVGALVSGASASPLLPLLLAPLVIAFAAFGRRRATLVLLLAVLAAVLALAALPRGVPWPAFAEPQLGWMRVVSLAATAVLAWTGVAGLTAAHGGALVALERMRRAGLEEAATRMRTTELVGARVAHEIKNPLAAMKALVQVERAARSPEERGHLRLGVVLDEIDRLDQRVRDYLDHARPVTELRVEPVDLGALVEGVVSLLSARAEARGVTLATEATATIVRGDRARLHEAVFNLADNALAHSPAGGRMTIAVGPAPPGCRITVRDQGPGYVAAAGAAFVSTRVDGTGLGLVIARTVVERHGGRLSFELPDGGGTIAVMTLPAEPGGPIDEEAAR